MVLLWIVIAALGLGAGGKQFAIHGIYELPLDTVKTPADLVEKLIFKIRGEAYSDIRKISTLDPAMASIEKRLVNSTDTEDLYKINRTQAWRDDGVCAPWDQASANCSCDQVCPLSFSLFSVNADQIHMEEKNALKFKNHDYNDLVVTYDAAGHPHGDGKGYWDGHNLGHCWGHAVFSQKIQRLAIFAPEEKAPYEEGSKKWIKFYRKILKKIARDQTQVIPGFKSIEEISSHQALKDEFANRISALWGNHAMTLEGFAQSSVRGARNNEFYLEYIRELKFRLGHFQKPAVYIGPRIPFLGAGQSHVSMVSRVYEHDGEITVCYEDNNSTPEENKRCRPDHSDHFKLDGTPIAIWYGPKNIVYHENEETAADLRSLWKMCRKTRCGVGESSSSNSP